MRRSVVISVALHGAILLWIVVMFPLGRALNESPKDIPLDIMSPAEFTKLKAGMAHAKADKPLKAKAEEPKPKAVTEKKPVEQATPAPTQKPAEKKPKPKPKTVVAPKPKKALAPKQAEATPKKPVKTAKDDKPKPKPKPKPEKKRDLDSDRIAALLNKIPDAKNAPTPQEIVEETPEEPVRGQSMGTDTAMSVNEIDALRARIAQCWNPPPGGLGAEAMVVKIRLKLNEDGTLVGYPTVANHGNSPFFQAAADAAVRAVFQCQPYMLPNEKFTLWRDMILNFDPSRMYGSG